MRVIIIVDKFLVRPGDFDRVQVHALDVLDEGPFAHHLVVEVFVDLCLDGRKTGELACAGTAFTADNLVAVAHLAQHDGLDKPLLLNGVCKFGEFFFVENRARLVGVPVDELDGDFYNLLAAIDFGFTAGRIVFRFGRTDRCRHVVESENVGKTTS